MTRTLRHAGVAAPEVSRERLLAAMVRTAARHSYTGATVSRVVGDAGATRAVFYEHFCNREDCFLAAHQAAAERALRCLGAEEGSRVSLGTALQEVLVRAAENPATTRFLLIETLGASQRARLRHEEFLARLEAVIDASLEPGRAPQLTASALLDGVIGVIANRLLGGEAAALPELEGGLLAWGRAYRVPAGADRLSQQEWAALGRTLAPAEPGREADVSLLPRGRSALDRAAGAASRRRRVVVATAEAVARKGFAALTVADIVATARVPRSAFYAQFAGKEGAFRAVQEEVLREAMAAAASRFALGASWPERVWNGLEGLLYYIAERPDLARAGVIEVQSAGEAATRRSQQICLAFTLFLEEGFRRSERASVDPQVCAEAIAFAIHGVMRRALAREGASRLPELLPFCTHLALAPFVGARHSLEFVTERAQAVG